MRKPGHIPISAYDYNLPDACIARYPLEERGESKLLVYNKGIITSKVFRDTPSLLYPGDHLYFNVTRVVQARLLFRKETGGRIEIFILEPHQPADHQLAFSSTESVSFICLVGNAKKWKQGPLSMQVGDIVLEAFKEERHTDKFIIRFTWDTPTVSFGELLEKAGSTPIPPYLGRDAEKKDATTYQTVYARDEGSVAAPTAGLHFTQAIMDRMSARGIKQHDLTLHVGAGTFIPVKEENAAKHAMHAELVTVSRELLESLVEEQRRTIAVGTTTTRTLESLYWLGVRAYETERFSFDELYLDQWDAYTLNDRLSAEQSFNSLIEHLDDAGLDKFSFRTRIMITPGYRFRVIDGLFTNFHQPKSTLLLLIAALVGDDWRKIYDFALKEQYRFLSYGDGSLLWKK